MTFMDLLATRALAVKIELGERGSAFSDQEHSGLEQEVRITATVASLSRAVALLSYEVVGGYRSLAFA